MAGDEHGAAQPIRGAQRATLHRRDTSDRPKFDDVTTTDVHVNADNVDGGDLSISEAVDHTMQKDGIIQNEPK